MFQRQPLFGRMLSQVLLIVAVFIVVLPLVLIVQQSLQGQGLDNYLAVLTQTPFLTFIGNSGVIALITVAIVLVLSMSAAYAVDVLRPRWSTPISILIFGGLSLPAIAIVVPLFSLIQALGLLDTYWAVIIPLVAGSIPFGVLLSGTHLRALPKEIHEAAKIDGASSFRFLISILVPLSRPILAVVAIFTFLSAWNEYVIPLIFIQSSDMQVATQVPTFFESQHLVDVAKVLAANALISVPVVLAYVVLQRQFRQGLSGGAVK